MKDDISKLIQNFSGRFLTVSSSPFHSNDSTRIITKELPSRITDALALDDTYKVYGSVGTGNWSEIPWIAILDKSITKSTREGYYIVFLFNKSLQSIHLCLSVGWTQFEEEYGIKEGRQQIKATCKHYARLLESSLSNFHEGVISLNAKNNLGKGYEAGAILSREYSVDSLKDERLIEDIKKLLFTYQELKDIVGSSILNLDVEINNYNNEIRDFKKKVARESFSKDTGSSLKRLIEAANESPPDIRTKLKKEIVRNRKFATYVKEKAQYICELCGRPPFMQKNGALYAEADHIIPLGHDTKGLDSPDNMRCLCPLCHAVITHGSDEEIKKLIL